ncbi:MAG: PEP-CTERM system TPR-repeat protein PrsT, partial [Nitrosomonas sp.]|nr:PEP-CTERM system TPR-repeat protein PrsT [Nitrosomonas sp.]
LESVKAISPNLLNLFYTQALLEFNQENYADALASIQQVLRPAPNHMPSVLLAGAIQHALGSLVQAEDYLNQYIEVVPNNLYAIKLMATVLLKNKHAQESIDVIAPALKVIDQDPQLFALAGEAYMQTGDFAKANEFFEKANNLVPDNAAIHTAIGISKLAQGDNIHAINELEMAINLEGDTTRAGTLLVMTHLRLQEFDKALQAAEKLEKEEPDNPLFLNLKGGVYLGMKDNANARATFNKALSLQADYFPAISNLARLDLHDNKPEAAKKRFESLLAKDNKNIPAMNALANLALNQKDFDSATKWLEIASTRNPNEVQPAIQLAAHYLRLGEKEKPLQISQKLMGLYPEDPRVLDILAQSLLANNRKSAALETYEKIAARLPDSAAVQFRIASIHASQENMQAASNALRNALQIKPDYLEAKLAQVRIAVHNKNESEALALAKNIQNQHDKSSIGFVIEGDLLIRSQPTLALKAYEQAFTKEQNGPLLIKLHAALSQSGKEKEANERLTKWLTDNPTDAQTRLYRAGLYLSKQQNDAAIKEYEVIIQQHPDHAISLNNLAWLYQQNKDSRAVEYAERAYQQAPEAPAILDTLGWILYENGDLSRALSILQKAASLAPDANDIQYHFAAALAKSGDNAKAKGILEKILASGNTFTQIEDARNLLTQLQ